MSDLSYQQSLVWVRLSETLTQLNEANDYLESRATKLAVASTSVFTVITGANMFPGTSGEIGRGETIALGVLCGLSVLLIWFASRVWGPGTRAVPGGYDQKRLKKFFLEVDKDTAFDHGVTDFAHSIEHAIWANRQKGKNTRHMLYVVQSQLIVLATGVLCRVIV